MHNTTKVSHFHGAPSRRLLEMYCDNIITNNLSRREKIIRFFIRSIGKNYCSLLCGRTQYKSNGQSNVRFSILKTTLIQGEIWHVKGTLAGKRTVLMQVDKEHNVCDIIEKY